MRKRDRLIQKAAEKLAAIAVKHLDALSPAERERRIKALEKTLSTKRPSGTSSIAPRPSETQEFRLLARDRDE